MGFRGTKGNNRVLLRQRDSVMHLMASYHSPRPSWKRPVQLPWQCGTGTKGDEGQETTKELSAPILCLFLIFIVVICHNTASANLLLYNKGSYMMQSMKP